MCVSQSFNLICLQCIVIYPPYMAQLYFHLYFVFFSCHFFIARMHQSRIDFHFRWIYCSLNWIFVNICEVRVRVRAWTTCHSIPVHVYAKYQRYTQRNCYFCSLRKSEQEGAKRQSNSTDCICLLDVLPTGIMLRAFFADFAYLYTHITLFYIFAASYLLRK